MSAPPVARAGLAYWTHRAEQLGARAVVNVDHPPDRDLATMTAGHAAVLFPRCPPCSTGPSAWCATPAAEAGRFTPDLAGLIGGRAIGIEPVDDAGDSIAVPAGRARL